MTEHEPGGETNGDQEQVRYQIRMSGPARRDLARLPDRVLHAVLAFLDGPLTENPHRVGKPLRADLLGLYSARRGSFRILYEIDDNEILVEVVRIAHRADNYRP